MNNNEKWQEIYTINQLLSIQLLEKEILKEFIRICNQLDIEYFLYGGTLLGQIKYNDIIPWDDDIDVALTRDNYNRFLNEAPKLLEDRFVLQSPYIEKKSPFSYTKLRLKGTKYIEEYHHKLDIEKGIYIDIYPVDNIPDDEKLRKKQWKMAQFYCKLYYVRQCIHADFSIRPSRFINYVKMLTLYILLHLLPQSHFMNRIDYYMTKYNDIKATRKACLYSPNYNNIYIKLYPLLEKKFGNITVMIPNCYDDHLLKRYGNYKEDLSDDKKVGHIPYEIFIPEELMVKDGEYNGGNTRTIK